MAQPTRHFIGEWLPANSPNRLLLLAFLRCLHRRRDLVGSVGEVAGAGDFESAVGEGGRAYSPLQPQFAPDGT